MHDLPSSPNRLLASLLPADLELLRPHLKPIELKHEEVLFDAGDKIDRVYFPHSGIISLVVELAGGEAIEAAMIGREIRNRLIGQGDDPDDELHRRNREWLTDRDGLPVLVTPGQEAPLADWVLG